MAVVDRATDLAGVVLSHSGSLVASLVVWLRHRAVGAVAIVGLSVRDQRVGNRLRSVARGDWGASDNATFVKVVTIAVRRKNTDRSAQNAFRTFQILEKSLGNLIYETIVGVIESNIFTFFSFDKFSSFKIQESASVRILIRILSAVLVNLFKRVVFISRLFTRTVTVLINCKRGVLFFNTIF